MQIKTLDAVDPSSPGNAAAGERPPTTATILVVDDEPMALQMFADLLQARGFGVIAVARGEDAFQWLDAVDLVLLDAMLPGRDGWSICREIKEKYDPLLPVVMVTARTAPDDVVRTFEAGADDYVAKPFHAAELTARIESRLRVHRAERALQDANRQLSALADQNYTLYDQARRDAEERSHLLRELDHRVRNNLSVIMGLVNMERNRRPPRPVGEALASLESRLRSFLMVLEALRRMNYRTVPLREIAEKMAQRLRNSMGLDERVELEITGSVPGLDERQGFALALALNELISNSLRHAFPDNRPGCVRIHLAEEREEMRIEVSDDGIGSQPGERSGVLGSGRSIVEALVRGELGGQVERLPSERGTRVLLSFPRTPPAA
ncbi:MAG: response regulator [Gemmatimonadetes bacterium]|nr:response regulator [Gemmatimonadota bacterium]